MSFTANTRTVLASGLTIIGLSAVGCRSEPTTPIDAAHVASIIPAANATSVDPNAPVTVEFTHAMMAGMEQYVALHEGDVTGPTVSGTWTWSSDRTRLTFMPVSPLKPGTRHTIHVGGGLRDASGNPLGLDQHCQQLGGQWATGQMMGTGTMNGGMMGSGWQHANGTHGMVFTFTTR